MCSFRLSNLVHKNLAKHCATSEVHTRGRRGASTTAPANTEHTNTPKHKGSRASAQIKPTVVAPAVQQYASEHANTGRNKQQKQQKTSSTCDYQESLSSRHRLTATTAFGMGEWATAARETQSRIRATRSVCMCVCWRRVLLCCGVAGLCTRVHSNTVHFPVCIILWNVVRELVAWAHGGMDSQTHSSNSPHRRPSAPQHPASDVARWYDSGMIVGNWIVSFIIIFML